jgi:biopolymer transport protein ExbB/TolQ
MAASTRVYAFDYSRRAAQRAAATLRLKMSHGATTLRAIAGTAPMLGMFATTVELVQGLRTIGPVCSECDYSGGWSEALVPMAIGLVAGILASIALHCLNHRIEDSDLEMRKATFDFLDALARRSSPR